MPFKPTLATTLKDTSKLRFHLLAYHTSWTKISEPLY